MLIKETSASTAACLISRSIYAVLSLEKLSFPVSTPIPLNIFSDIRRCGYVPCHLGLIFQQVGDRHLSDLKTVGALLLRKLGHLQVYVVWAEPANSYARK